MKVHELANAKWIALVKGIHYLVVAFILFGPFISSEVILTYHAIAVPFLMMHWLSNDHTCVLTWIECKLRGLDRPDESFIGAIIKPIYSIKDRDFYIVASVLWIISMYRLKTEYNFHLLRLVWKTIRSFFV